MLILNDPQSLNRYAYVMNNPVNMWDPTGHVAEYVYGGSYTGSDLLPSWVRNYESHSESETVNGTLYAHIWTPTQPNPTYFPGTPELIDVKDMKTFYRHYLRSQETTIWHYEYTKWRDAGDGIAKIADGPNAITFSETITKEGTIDISAKDIAKVNQDYIAGLEMPPNSVIKVEQRMNGKTLTKELLNSHLSKHEGKQSTGDPKNLIPSIPFTMKGLHMVLDVIGLTPIGPIADAVNSLIYLVEGDWKNAGLSVLSAIPIIGDVLGGGKLAVKYGDDVLQVIDYLRGYLQQKGLYKKLEDVYQSVTFIPGVKVKNVDEIADAGKGTDNGATYEGTLYRSVGEGHDPLLIHEGNINANHRYTAPGTGGLYFSTGEKIVNAELNTWNVATKGRVMHSFDVKVDNLLDVSNPNVRKQLGIKLDDIIGNSYDVTHKIGQYAKENGFNGIVAPSARADGGLNLILFEGSTIKP